MCRSRRAINAHCLTQPTYLFFHPAPEIVLIRISRSYYFSVLVACVAIRTYHQQLNKFFFFYSSKQQEMQPRKNQVSWHDTPVAPCSSGQSALLAVCCSIISLHSSVMCCSWWNFSFSVTKGCQRCAMLFWLCCFLWGRPSLCFGAIPQAGNLISESRGNGCRGLLKDKRKRRFDLPDQRNRSDSNSARHEVIWNIALVRYAVIRSVAQ